VPPADQPPVALTSRWTPGAAGLAAGAASALLVWAPLLRPGYVLSYDMVFVPRPALDRTLLGLGPVVARAVPSDLLVALASRVLPGQVVQRLVLVLLVVLGAWGAARLLPLRSPLAGAVTAVAWVWTPATYERLVLGQWALLVSLAALPWAVAAAAGLRAGGRSRALLLALAAAGCGSPAGGLLVGAVAVLVACWPGGPRPVLSRLTRSAVPALLVLLPWALPSLLRPGGVPGDPAGLAAFAPRADTALGPVGSVLSLGGVWTADVAPPGRDALVLLPIAVLVLLAAAAGVRAGLRGPARPTLLALAAAAAAGLVLALAPRLPGLDALARAAVAHLPGGGLLRDGQKYAAPYALLVALGLGLCADLALVRLPQARDRRVAAGLLLLAPVALVPALAWGAGGRLAPVGYPAPWLALRGQVAAGPGAVLLLPWRAYRAPAWNGRRVLLDPAPRLLGRTVVTDDDLVLSDRTVQGEDPVAARLDALVSGSDPLTRPLSDAGIGWVVVEHGEVGAEQAAGRLAGARLAVDGPVLALWQLPSPARLVAPEPPAVPVVAADVALAVLVLLAAAAAVWDRLRALRPRDS